MEAIRAIISGWTSSFRYPIFVCNVQPTLDIPPLSTIYGLLSAARGDYVNPKHTGIGYRFYSASKFFDLETIYEMTEGSLKGKSNVCRREILFQPRLELYVTNLDFLDCLKKPYYPLLLGRQTEPAIVEKVQKIQLTKMKRMKLEATLVPFPTEGVSGVIQALPEYFTGTVPRKSVNVRPYCLLTEEVEVTCDNLYFDEELNKGVYIYNA